jgi:hypothetical protein
LGPCHYEGDTLVVDTVGIKVGRYAMVDWYGTPHTEALLVVERYRIPRRRKRGSNGTQRSIMLARRTANRNGKYLQLEFAVEDEGVFTTPWKATMTYTAIPFDWTESVCPENISSGTRDRMPTCRGRTNRISDG